MREDPFVDVVMLCILLATLFSEVATAFSRGADGLNWELRWQALDDRERAWIAIASISTSSETRAALEERGETELAEGCRRRERRRRAYVGLATLPLLVTVAALAVSGLLPHSTGTFAIVIFGTLPWLGTSLRDRQIKNAYRRLQAERPTASVIVD